MTSVTSCGGVARDRLTVVPIQSEQLASEKPRATFCERSIIQQLIVIQAYLKHSSHENEQEEKARDAEKMANTSSSFFVNHRLEHGVASLSASSSNVM